MEKMDNRVPKGPKRTSQSQPSNVRSYLERRRRSLSRERSETEANGSWYNGTPDSRSRWSNKRSAAQSWDDTHRETTLNEREERC